MMVKMQLWGAPGGGLTEQDNNKSNIGGYSYGEILLNEGDLLYVNVGEKGKLSNKKSSTYNGGGYSAYVAGITSSSGGGATDIRYGGTSLDNRILVAGGGGGSININGTKYYGHKGGGLFGNTITQTNGTEGIDGSSIFVDQSKLLNEIYNSFITTGVKGSGGNSLVYYLNNTTPVIGSGGGGGGGYYGGSGGANAGGGGGSGFVNSEIIQNGLTTTANNGPTDGGFARVCWGDWYNLNNPCTSSYENELSYQHNAGKGDFFDIDESITCENLTEAMIKDQQFSGIGKCSRENLKKVLEENHAELPSEITDDMLPDYYYEGMSIRNQCESGYNITDGDNQNRIELTCGSDNNWIIKGKCTLKPGCYEFTSNGTGKKLDFSTVHNDISEIQIQAWGAPGGSTSGKTSQNYGGYSKGTLRLTNNNKVIYVVVGGKGGDGAAVNTVGKGGTGGFNGGGNGGGRNSNNASATYGSGGGGGGATDIRYGGLALTNRVIVAGGAGGSVYVNNGYRVGGNGGASIGSDATGGSTGEHSYLGLKGSQTTGGTIVIDNSHLTTTNMLTSGVLGQGGFGDLHWTNDNGFHSGAGGGGGYYGGSGGANAAGGGGSGYIGGVTNGSTSIISSGPTDGGFARICWGDWTGQTNPCSVTNHNSNAGITTNSTKCTLNSSLTNVTPNTLNTCSRDSMLAAFTAANVRQPNNAAANLPEKYYEGMKVRGDCNSSYIIMGGNNGKVEFTCQSNGTWSKSGECGVLVKYISITNSSKYNEKIFTPGTNVTCNNATFGDPYTNIAKYCMIGNTRVAYEGDSFVASINAEATKKCHKYYIDAGTNIANSNFNNTSYTGSGNTVVNNGASVDLSCNTGYISVQAKATCDNGTWKYSGNCMKNCTVSNPANGYWKLNNSTTLADGATVNHGNSVTMACNSDYSLFGSSVATCNNGSWSFSSNSGICRKNCSKPSVTKGCSNKFGIFKCEIYRDCIASSNVTIKYGETTFVSCSKTTSNDCFGVGDKTVKVSVKLECGDNGTWIEVDSSCSLN